MNPCQAGDRINNYILQELLGSGSFGQVWKARHHVFQQTVAVKIPTDAVYVRNLQREGVAIHGLRHPNIVRALDMDPYADPAYLIMEYVDGPTLRRIIDDHPDGLCGADVPIVSEIMEGMLSALSAAHQAGIIHRDLKPANILIALGSDAFSTLRAAQVKVSDFGLGLIGDMTTASIMHSGSLRTEAGKSISGTIAYMSPEQRDGQALDHRSDLYAVGIMLFELLTGIRPQGSDVPSDIRPNCPEDFDAIFLRCYTHRDRRYASADGILADLRALRGTTRPVSAVAARDTATGPGSCPRCGKRVHVDDQYCIHCGRQLVAVVRKCPACNAVAHKRDQFCIMCGSDLRVLLPGSPS